MIMQRLETRYVSVFITRSAFFCMVMISWCLVLCACFTILVLFFDSRQRFVSELRRWSCLLQSHFLLFYIGFRDMFCTFCWSAGAVFLTVLVYSQVLLGELVLLPLVWKVRNCSCLRTVTIEAFLLLFGSWDSANNQFVHAVSGLIASLPVLLSADSGCAS